MNTVLFFVPLFPKGHIEKRKIGELKKLAPLKMGSKLPDKCSKWVSTFVFEEQQNDLEAIFPKVDCSRMTIDHNNLLRSSQ